MKSTVILIPVDCSDFKVFAAAARLVRKECGVNAPDTVMLIQFQLAHRTAGDIAKDFLDCMGDFAARRRVPTPLSRKFQGGTNPLKSRASLPALRPVRRPADFSRN
ncbi:MAG: hypothetical protein Q7S40_33805 [Opitutaceae bacterium]|nr:hypothetical protein [Opitutaceae bacterium]